MSSTNRTTPAAPRRWLWPVIILVVIVAAAGGYLKSRDSGNGPAFRTAAVERGEIRTAISATGTLSATATVDVGTQVSGILQSVSVDFNDTVKKDQVIARIDPSTFQARLDQVAQLNQTHAQAVITRYRAVNKPPCSQVVQYPVRRRRVESGLFTDFFQ